jgi:hypothetical protein
MRAAKMTDRPEFALMRQTDIQSVYHVQMPRWLFSDPRYADDMSLDAKVTYTFLLNRFQLSRRNGWVNENGEVFVIFPRKALAAELRICEQRVTTAFKKLAELQLIWEKRCGRGDANQIYLACVTPIEDPDYGCAPFLTPQSAEDCGSRTADSEVLEKQEPRDLSFKNRGYGASRTSDFEVPEPQNPRASNTEKRNIEISQKEVSQSVGCAGADGPTGGDEKELEEILESCELYCFPRETAQVFENAVERLFYSDSFGFGNATLPQKRVRAKLRLLDGIILQSALGKLNANLEYNVRNSTAYTMSTIFNSIAENEGDLLVDPYLNGLRDPPGRCPP